MYYDMMGFSGMNLLPPPGNLAEASDSGVLLYNFTKMNCTLRLSIQNIQLYPLDIASGSLRRLLK